MTTKSGGTEKPPTKQPRNRDNNLRGKPAQHAAETFADAIATDGKRGAVTRAAKKAYPNQSRQAAAVTGSRLLKHPNVQEMIARRRENAIKAANISRNEVMGLLAQQARASLADVLNEDGTALDLQRARENGLDHLIREITVTERHHTKRVQAGKDSKGRQKYRTETHRRTTTKYKIHDPQKAKDLLAEIAGWKKQPAKNPLDSARETYRIMRQDDRYKDVPDEELASFPAQRFEVSVAEILEGANA